MYSLQEVMAAKSIAVFGASRDPFKPGSMLIQVLKDTGFQGEVAGVNPQGGQVYKIPLYRTIGEIPFAVDLAALIIPPAAVPQALRECAVKGVKGVVISSEGFAESGQEGKRYQAQIQVILQETGMRCFGPNTLGIVNTETGLTTSYFADRRMLKPGSIGFAAQSGIFVGALLRYLGSWRIHISKGFGLGNKVDVDESDVLDYFTEDEQTRTVGLYLEGIRDGERFMEAARRAAARKPVVLLKGGRSAEGAVALASHTASLALDDAVLDGALRQAGILRMQDIEELLGTLIGFDWTALPRGNRVAVVTYSGAQAILCVDRAMELGLELARFTDETQRKLSAVIPTGYKRQNPIDIFPDMMARGFEETALGILKALLEDDGVHGIIFISFAIFGSDAYRPVVKLLEGRMNKPVFFSTFGAREDVEACRELLLAHRVPWVSLPETAARALAHMWRYARWAGVA
ncbi:MAG: CoA-binding protein [Deltaproteobacteria bacterium]|nr:CoA-binding protein [Deltaproteobacteria bacterium]